MQFVLPPNRRTMKFLFLKLSLLIAILITALSCSVESELEDMADEIERGNNAQPNSEMVLNK